MQYLALATDYDGTLAHNGHVDDATLLACRQLQGSGRKLILVTGRELPELRKTFPEYQVCDLIVAENGGLLYWPSDGREELLADPPPPEFAAEIQARGLTPCSFGRIIVATWQPHEAPMLEIIRELGLEYQIIFNKGAVMVLPSGVNKATGLVQGLQRLGLAADQVVGVGDAENDHAFLDACAVAVAVENALPALKQRCDLVTAGDHGRGVQELIGRILADDLQSLGTRRPRRPVSAAPRATA